MIMFHGKTKKKLFIILIINCRKKISDHATACLLALIKRKCLELQYETAQISSATNHFSFCPNFVASSCNEAFDKTL